MIRRGFIAMNLDIVMCVDESQTTHSLLFHSGSKIAPLYSLLIGIKEWYTTKILYCTYNHQVGLGLWPYLVGERGGGGSHATCEQ